MGKLGGHSTLILHPTKERRVVDDLFECSLATGKTREIVSTKTFLKDLGA